MRFSIVFWNLKIKSYLFKCKGCTGIQVQWNKELSESYIMVLAKGRNGRKWDVQPGKTPSEMSVNCPEKYCEIRVAPSINNAFFHLGLSRPHDHRPVIHHR